MIHRHSRIAVARHTQYGLDMSIESSRETRYQRSLKPTVRIPREVIEALRTQPTGQPVRTTEDAP